MSINFVNLVAQGRAKAMGVCWTPEELDALLTLEKECGLARTVAADYIRNGIMTVEDYNKAKEVDFKPKTIEEAVVVAEEVIKEKAQEAIKTSTGKKKTK